jgi:hypothetical protein
MDDPGYRDALNYLRGPEPWRVDTAFVTYFAFPDGEFRKLILENSGKGYVIFSLENSDWPVSKSDLKNSV